MPFINFSLADFRMHVNENRLFFAGQRATEAGVKRVLSAATVADVPFVIRWPCAQRSGHASYAQEGQKSAITTGFHSGVSLCKECMDWRDGSRKHPGVEISGDPTAFGAKVIVTVCF